LYEKFSTGVLREELKYEDVLETVKLLIKEFPTSMKLLNVRPMFKRQQDNFDKILKVLTHLFYVLNVIRKTGEQFEDTKNLLNSIHKMNPRNSYGDSLLHLVVSKTNTMKSNTFVEDPHTIIFPDARVCKLLLDCDFNVDAINNIGSTALHIACTRGNFNIDVVNHLLNYGAHIDRRNVTGSQAHKILSSISECTINPLKFITLKCLAARIIVDRQIRYIGEIPLCLEEFIRIH
jgi:hypothetical protein